MTPKPGDWALQPDHPASSEHTINDGWKVFKKRIGYGKIGRVLEVDHKKWGESGGDNEPPHLLMTLAQRHPDVQWVVVGKNSGWESIWPNIENPWTHWREAARSPAKATMMQRTMKLDALTGPTFDSLDGMVFWLGQHGTSNSPIPKVKDQLILTSPQVSFVEYVSFIARGINRWRNVDPLNREEVWLLPDARNYLKMRDLTWPRNRPILCQYDWTRGEWCERYGDDAPPAKYGFTSPLVSQDSGTTKWRTMDYYKGSGLELVGIPGPIDEPYTWDARDHDFGVLINEARNYGMRPELTRLHAMQNYIKPLNPSWVNGTWTPESKTKLDMDIRPLPYWDIFPMMNRTKSTFTTPSSGSGWATAKPWECFATGVICFFHPAYDTQNHILRPNGEKLDGDTAVLYNWLRVKSPEDLKKKVQAVASSESTYEWLAEAQRRVLTRELKRQRCVTEIEERLGL